MKTYLYGIPCFFNQALRAGRIATGDETKLKKLMDEIGLMLRDIPLESSPLETGGNADIRASKSNYGRIRSVQGTKKGEHRGSIGVISRFEE